MARPPVGRWWPAALAVAGLVLSLSGCAAVWRAAPVADESAAPAADTLSAPSGDAEVQRLLLTARWHLLRALDERSRSHYEEAQADLDAAFHLIAALQDGLESGTRTPAAAEAPTEGPVEGSLAAAVPAPETSEVGRELDHLGDAVEEAYLSILPHLDSFSPDSPLSLLLQSMSAERLDELPADAGQLVRIHQLAPQCSLPVDANARVAATIRFFQTRGRDTYATWTRRSGQYRDLILPILREEGVPEDLLYLAMIESGFNPRAYSRAHAAGLWQFIAPTGQLMGLRFDNWVDERRDPVRSTRAAAQHLKALYAELGDWRLAAAAYNSGLGRVRRAIDQGGTRDFWSLQLPSETRNYVPLLMAATIIAKDPTLFGFEELPLDPPLRYEEVQLSRFVDLKRAARAMGVTVEELRLLNPELRRAITPPLAKVRYSLRVPPGKGEVLVTEYPRLPASGQDGVVEYVVQRGDNISSIASAFGVQASLITDANGLDNPHLIRPGQKLYVPAGEGPRASRPAAARASGGQSYTVRRGDSLSGIAQHLGVTVAQLRSWNGLRGDLIRPGQRLHVGEAVSAPARQPRLTTAEGGRLHTVERGESLWSIARRFAVSVDELRRWNRLPDTTIHPGQKLVVGVADDGIYTVENGDTLYGIARRFGLDARDIARHNNLSLSTTLVTGMQLRLRVAEGVE
ncbi:MAG: LysM peptidoglycan-binding domain-containing protein [Gemmatimonadota bacterium]